MRVVVDQGVLVRPQPAGAGQGNGGAGEGALSAEMIITSQRSSSQVKVAYRYLRSRVTGSLAESGQSEPKTTNGTLPK